MTKSSIFNIWNVFPMGGNSRLEVLCKKGVLKNFTKLIEKQPSWSLFFPKQNFNPGIFYAVEYTSLNGNAKQHYWNPTSTWVFSCKFAAYFQNNFSLEHLWRAASGKFHIHLYSRMYIPLRKICQNTGQRKPVFWHILSSVQWNFTILILGY